MFCGLTTKYNLFDLNTVIENVNISFQEISSHTNKPLNSLNKISVSAAAIETRNVDRHSV